MSLSLAYHASHSLESPAALPAKLRASRPCWRGSWLNRTPRKEEDPRPQPGGRKLESLSVSKNDCYIVTSHSPPSRQVRPNTAVEEARRFSRGVQSKQKKHPAWKPHVLPAAKHLPNPERLKPKLSQTNRDSQHTHTKPGSHTLATRGRGPRSDKALSLLKTYTGQASSPRPIVTNRTRAHTGRAPS